MSFLHLNTAQQAAVTTTDGPALVLAGAGSGKTRVIVERIVWLIEERGIEPRNILALTFTNRAADEMKQRVRERLGVQQVSAWVGTFHSFGLYVLRRDIKALDRPRSFTVFDDTDQLALMKRLIKGLGAKWAKVNPREALNWISQYKQDVEEPEPETDESWGEEATCVELWKQYHAALSSAAAVDFDDLLSLTVELFEEHEDVLQKYHERFTHILVDEYQDTNRAQYRIVRALAGPKGDLFVVGDEDQSIYSWRGADLRNILDFESDFPGARVHRLEQNYRSTKPILDAANAVVANNVDRLGKTLWTDRTGGEKVRFYLAQDGEDEADFIIDSIREYDLPLSQVAVFYRTNGQARVVEEAFMRRGIAYTVVGGIRFYQRKEIKDILSYLRLLVNPADEESLRRIVNVPPRGFGSATLQRLERYASKHHVTLLKALQDAEEDTTATPRLRSGAQDFVTMLDDLTREARSGCVEAIVERVLEETDYREFVKKSDERDFRSRLDVIDEFLSACAEFDGRNEGGLHDFLNELSLMGDTDRFEAGRPAAALMTCHNAKGLEFDHVYLIGLEEGFLPHANSLDCEESLEEERRLCYVAMTRARKSLTLVAARSRVIFGDRAQREVSRFVGEIPPDWLQGIKTKDASPEDTSPASEASTTHLQMGTRIRHAKFGKGVVMFTAGSGDKLRVRIRFDTGMSKQFMVRHAPLEILDKR